MEWLWAVVLLGCMVCWVVLAVLALLALLALAPVAYVACRKRGQRRWQELVVRREVRRVPTPFRDSETVAVFCKEAPGDLRRTAFACIVLAELALFGLVADGYSLYADAAALRMPLAVAGVAMVAFAFGTRLFFTGRALLLHQDGVAERATRSARIAIWLGGALAAVAAWAKPGDGVDDRRWYATLLVYALLLVLVGALLGWAVRRHRAIIDAKPDYAGSTPSLSQAL